MAQTRYCVNQYSNTNTCSAFEIQQYNRDVDAYNTRLQGFSREREAYIQQLQSYLDRANEFTRCEAREMNGSGYQALAFRARGNRPLRHYPALFWIPQLPTHGVAPASSPPTP